MEANLNYVEAFASKALDRLGHERELSSEIVCRTLGQVLAEAPRGSGVLRSAYQKGVSVYLATWAMKRAQSQGVQDPMALFDHVPRYNPFLDLTSFALGAKRLGIFTIGGGVPRNWAQEVGPFVDITNHRLEVNLTPPRYQYAVRICPEPVHWAAFRAAPTPRASPGEVRPARRGRPLRRGLRRRHHRVAASRQGRDGGAEAVAVRGLTHPSACNGSRALAIGPDVL